MRARSVSTVLLTLAAACGGEEPSNRRVTVRDSAGITIVENQITADICAVASTADLDLGLVDGPPEYQFYRVFDAATLSDGRIAVVNQGSDEIRIYAPDGAFERAFGSRGGGPGEFNDILQLWVGAGDTLTVGDYNPWRFSFFTATGAFVRAVVPEPEYLNADVAQPLGDGTFLMAQSSGQLPEGEGNWVGRTLSVVLHAADGSMSDTLAVLPYGRWGWLDLDLRLMGNPVFEARGQVAAGGTRVITGGGTKTELKLFDLLEPGQSESGSTVVQTGLLRWSGRDLTITEDHLEEYRRQQRETYADRDDDFTRRVVEANTSSDRPVAEHFPAHGSIEIGLEGDIWVRDYPRPGEEDPGWLVFDAEGRFECRAFLPFENTWDLYEIGPDYVLGKVTDELDVEHVRMYGLER